MLVAKQKRKENIAEYILYFYQIEDLIRAFQFDAGLIEKKLVPNYNANESTSIEINEWYKNLILMMEKEGVKEKGHLQFLVNQLNELNEFHIKLLTTNIDNMYVSTFQAVAGLLTELKTKNAAAENDVQVCLDGIYGYLMLKMQKKPISNETEDAVKRLSNWMSFLSKLFKDYEAGDLEI